MPKIENSPNPEIEEVSGHSSPENEAEEVEEVTAGRPRKAYKNLYDWSDDADPDEQPIFSSKEEAKKNIVLQETEKDSGNFVEADGFTTFTVLLPGEDEVYVNARNQYDALAFVAHSGGASVTRTFPSKRRGRAPNPDKSFTKYVYDLLRVGDVEMFKLAWAGYAKAKPENISAIKDALLEFDDVKSLPID